MDYVILDTTGSTNSYASAHADELKDMTMIMTHRQEAGRGQRGNKWESEPGKNLTVTLVHKPAPQPEVRMEVRQFRMSEAVALAVVDTLAEFGINAKVKWPNDVYVDDYKICGILIEHSITGSDISNSRIGIGLNVNQRLFLSDAPNPISMVMANKCEEDYLLPEVADSLAVNLEKRLYGGRDWHEEYLNSLWRADGAFFPFIISSKPDSVVFAKIVDILPNGILVLQDSNGNNHEFRFKEVQYLLDVADTPNASV